VYGRKRKRVGRGRGGGGSRGRGDGRGGSGGARREMGRWRRDMSSLLESLLLVESQL